jgi:hypothetical protein
MPETPAPWVPPISPDLRGRIEGYNRDRGALVADYSAAQLRAGVLTPAGEHDQQAQRRAARMAEAAREFEADHANQIDALRVRYERIRSDLAEMARGLNDPRNGRPLTVDSLLEAYRVAMQRFDTIGREEAMYERYKLAMLQPGLSPAQRRLLFHAAHANLAQALPPGEVLLSTATRPMPRS